MKNFVKTRDREGSGFAVLRETFLWMSVEKLKATIFDSPQIREFMKDALSAVTLGLFSKELWRFDWSVGWAFSPRYLHYGRALPKYVNFLFDYCWCLKRGTVAAEQEEGPVNIFYRWIAYFVYFQFTMAQCELSTNISHLNLALLFHSTRK